MLPEINAQNQFLGADVAKDTITFFCPLLGKIETIINRAVTLRSFLKKHRNQILILEATGGYEVKAIEIAITFGMKIYRVNPYRVRSFMRASGQFAKTDALDAQALSAFAAQYHNTLQPFVLPTSNEKKLRQLTNRRDELIVIRTQERNRLKAPDNKILQSGIKKHLTFLEKQVQGIEVQIIDLVENDQELADKKKVLTSVAGVGNVTATNLLAALPELGTVNRKQIASLAGLAPFAKDSGTKTGYRKTGRGRTNVRRILFMSALSAARYNPQIKSFYNRLIKNGKKPMVALIAVARKLLTILNAKVRDANLLKLQQQS